ncbi:MAG: hypothetical protein Q9183_003612 [Haloplaca sp. 2 TL-2023]
MVYGGKPSTGCQNCRKRKIKTEFVSQKAQRKRGRKSLNTKGGDRGGEESAKTTGPGIRQQQPRRSGKLPPSSAVATTATSGLSLPRPLLEPPERPAVNAFMCDYVLIPRHPYSRRGYLDCLLPLYQTTRHDSLLSLATAAVALAIEGGSPSNRHYRELSRSFFGKALVKTSKAIRDPIDSIKDETLMAVLLLSFYERILGSSEATDISGVHDTGAVALVKHRGKENGKSELSARLLLAVQTQVVEHCIQTSAAFGKTSADLDSLRPSAFENAASRLTSLSAPLSDLKAFANPILKDFDRSKPPPIPDLLSILNQANSIDALVSTWPATVPDDWAWRPSHTFDNLPSHQRKLFVYNRRVDIYHDIWVASIWNSYRSTIITIQFLILQTLLCLNPNPNAALSGPPPPPVLKGIMRIQEMADDICASVPFHLGTKTFGGPSDRGEVQYPDDGTEKPSNDYRRSAAGLGGWFVLEPLKMVAKAPALREGQQEWILKQIERIQRIYTIMKPIEMGVDEMPSPSCPGGR